MGEMATQPAPPMALPKLDGIVADRLVLSMTGAVELDRLDDSALELLEGVSLARDIRLVVVARAASKGFATRTSRDEDEPGGLTYQVKLKLVGVEPAE